MKKNFLILISFIILSVTAVYAKAPESKVPETITYQFSRDFSNASNVNWEVITGFYKASFNEQGKTLFAFYTKDAEFIGIAHYMVSDHLPASLLARIRKSYPDYWITELFSFDVRGDSGYFISLENADQIIRLKADANLGWQIYQTVNKN